jgi:hypothetical protein
MESLAAHFPQPDEPPAEAPVGVFDNGDDDCKDKGGNIDGKDGDGNHGKHHEDDGTCDRDGDSEDVQMDNSKSPKAPGEDQSTMAPETDMKPKGEAAVTGETLDKDDEREKDVTVASNVADPQVHVPDSLPESVSYLTELDTLLDNMSDVTYISVAFGFPSASHRRAYVKWGDANNATVLKESQLLPSVPLVQLIHGDLNILRLESAREANGVDTAQGATKSPSHHKTSSEVNLYLFPFPLSEDVECANACRLDMSLRVRGSKESSWRRHMPYQVLYDLLNSLDAVYFEDNNERTAKVVKTPSINYEMPSSGDEADDGNETGPMRKRSISSATGFRSRKSLSVTPEIASKLVESMNNPKPISTRAMEVHLSDFVKLFVALWDVLTEWAAECTVIRASVGKRLAALVGNHFKPLKQVHGSPSTASGANDVNPDDNLATSRKSNKTLMAEMDAGSQVEREQESDLVADLPDMHFYRLHNQPAHNSLKDGVSMNGFKELASLFRAPLGNPNDEIKTIASARSTSDLKHACAAMQTDISLMMETGNEVYRNYERNVSRVVESARHLLEDWGLSSLLSKDAGGNLLDNLKRQGYDVHAQSCHRESLDHVSPSRNHTDSEKESPGKSSNGHTGSQEKSTRRSVDLLSALTQCLLILAMQSMDEIVKRSVDHSEHVLTGDNKIDFTEAMKEGVSSTWDEKDGLKSRISALFSACLEPLCVNEYADRIQKDMLETLTRACYTIMLLRSEQIASADWIDWGAKVGAQEQLKASVPVLQEYAVDCSPIDAIMLKTVGYMLSQPPESAESADMPSHSSAVSDVLGDVSYLLADLLEAKNGMTGKSLNYHLSKKEKRRKRREME